MELQYGRASGYRAVAPGIGPICIVGPLRFSSVSRKDSFLQRRTVYHFAIGYSVHDLRLDARSLAVGILVYGNSHFHFILFGPCLKTILRESGRFRLCLLLVLRWGRSED
jgi:hypothetical protein